VQGSVNKVTEVQDSVKEVTEYTSHSQEGNLLNNLYKECTRQCKKIQASTNSGTRQCRNGEQRL
jgi:hypothetical protein